MCNASAACAVGVRLVPVYTYVIVTAWYGNLMVSHTVKYSVARSCAVSWVH